jgi:hypothetical protein
MEKKRGLILNCSLLSNVELAQQAIIIKYPKQGKYLIYGLSKIQMGANIASEPYIWLNESNSLHELVKQLFFALSQNKSDLPNPIDWKESASGFLKNAGLKKKTDLYKDSIHVGVQKKDGILYFTPTKNQGRKGFVNASNGEIEITENAGIEEIGKAIQEAFDKCE